MENFPLFFEHHRKISVQMPENVGNNILHDYMLHQHLLVRTVVNRAVWRWPISSLTVYNLKTTFWRDYWPQKTKYTVDVITESLEFWFLIFLGQAEQ